MKTQNSAQTVIWLDRVALIATLLTPLLLMHGHAIADGLIGVADLCFLWRCTMTRDWDWLRTAWVRVGLAWWGWVLICSLPIPALGLGPGGMGPLVLTLTNLRFLVFAAALEHVVLREPHARRWLWQVLAACVVWIAGSSLIQFIFGRNLFGFPPGGDGELTGPFGMPRAAPPLSRILLPVLLPLAVQMLAVQMLARRKLAATIAAYAILLGGVCIMVLIGQRMPMLLTVFGLAVAGLLLPQLRPVVATALAAGTALLAATAVISPPTYYRLVDKFSAQMAHFASSDYGQVYTRAFEMGRQNPVVGLGYDGYRHFCANPGYFRPTFDGAIANGGGAAICYQHPHNFYAQALVEGGFPGLILFCLLAIAWLAPLARGLWRQPDALRVGLFAAILIQLWPLASTSAFTSMPMGGWFFLLLGWAMAESRWAGPGVAGPGVAGPVPA